MPAADVPDLDRRPEIWRRPESLIDLLDRRTAEDPDAPLVRFQDGSHLSVGQLQERSLDLARRLSPLVRPGDIVASALRPGPGQVELMFALARLRALELPVAHDVSEQGIDTVLARANATSAVVDTGLCAGNPALGRLLSTVKTGLAAGADSRNVPHIETLPRGDLLPAPPDPSTPTLVIMTSGTTGPPKAAVLPHFAAVRHGRRVARSMGYTRGDVLFNCFPWHHVNVRHAGLLSALLSGATLVAHERFSASRFWPTCRAESVTAFNFMGVMVAILQRAAPSERDRDHVVRRAYGGPAPAALCHAFRDRFGVALFEAYASTELGDVSANTPLAYRPGSAGRPVPEYDVRIVGKDGSALPPGEVGQIAARAITPAIRFAGYLGDGGQPQVGPGGWFHTGDRGRMDEDGFLYFRGRHADVIRRRGENVSAWEVETALAGLPGLVDAAAVGVPSDLTEEDLLVAVQPALGAPLTAEQVHAWCVARLPRRAVPRFIRIVDTLPRNRSGKVVKESLKDVGFRAAAWDAERVSG